MRIHFNRKLNNEQNLCTHCVTLFLVPLLVVAGYADIGETGLLLHLGGRRHSKEQGRKVMCPPRDKTSSMQLAHPHPGSLGRRRNENRPLSYSGSETGVLLLSTQSRVVMSHLM